MVSELCLGDHGIFVSRYFTFFRAGTPTGVIVPYIAPGAHHLYHLYTVRAPGNGRPDRDAFARALAVRGVKATVSVPVPMRRMPAHRSGAVLPQTELVAADSLSLPVHSGITQRELTHVADACNALGGLI
ncbi:DegT/DnrJ/EryC1/StrS family aminotransferase [Actinacidiphila sp. ITFR-21]|uniref:DegT/DnrJ/EryC1/StrS family aminotransferase n=1 Tax=Actinacidiphila sp. ITFR-21 TaxID=3075199 RepID=UPI00288C11E5|nr:DegT/DnrJ/EryC1/StrS family aminotransferase [Streptomyces sp. ITFR-21]WNI18359.1 DegT/DnrJ/EryC1/StrS family aminotransferase [Streptomyces sp. ITFR-21]